MKVYLKPISLFDLELVTDGKFADIPEEVCRRIDDVKSASRKKEILGGYMLLKEALKERGILLKNVEIKYGKNGKPYIDGVHYNISHSADFITIAYGENECGIDIIKVTTFKENICERYFAESEREIIKKSQNKDEIFTLAWCLKEAYFKMTGEGITTRTKEVDFSELLTLKTPFKKKILGVNFYCNKFKENYFCICTKEKENIEVEYE